MKMKQGLTGLIVGLVFGGASIVNATVITIDNGTAGYSSTGFSNSTASCCVGQAIGSNYQVDTPNSLGDSATWDPTGLGGWMAGLWKVEMNWTVFNNRAEDALVTIETASATLTVNQTGSGGVWNDLGTFNFALAGSSVTIDDTNSDSGKYVIADAVRFTKVPEPSTLALFGIVLAGLGFKSRRR